MKEKVSLLVMEVCGAMGAQIRVRASLPSKGLGTRAARAKGPRTRHRNSKVPSPGRDVASTGGVRERGAEAKGRCPHPGHRCRRSIGSHYIEENIPPLRGMPVARDAPMKNVRLWAAVAVGAFASPRAQGFASLWFSPFVCLWAAEKSVAGFLCLRVLRTDVT